MKLRLGVQLFTLRKEIASPENIPSVFEFVKSTGAESVEFSRMPNMDAKELAKMAKDSGLAVCATHSSFERIQNDLDRLAEEHLLYGCPTIGIATVPPEFDKKSKDGLLRFADFMNKTQEKLNDKNLFLHYHNHAFEFSKIGGERILDILYKETVPEVKFCLDAFWAKVGKVNPADYIDKFGERIALLHMKDYKKIMHYFFKICAPGDGEIDYPALLTQSEKYNIPDAVIEIDIALNPRASIVRGMNYLKDNYINK